MLKQLGKILTLIIFFFVITYALFLVVIQTNNILTRSLPLQNGDGLGVAMFGAFFIVPIVTVLLFLVSLIHLKKYTKKTFSVFSYLSSVLLLISLPMIFTLPIFLISIGLPIYWFKSKEQILTSVIPKI